MEENKILWVDLQKKLEVVFDSSKVIKFESVEEKDINGYNWILSFHDFRTPTSLVIHTKFIFKLTEDKKHLRKNEFLYLKEMNCVYDIIKFKSLDVLEKDINEILMQNIFGDNLIALSEFMIEPERNINDEFVDKKIEGYSVFDFHYYPHKAIVPCQDMKYEFEFNVNNTQKVDLILKKIEDKFIYKFKTGGKIYKVEETSLNNIAKVMATFIQKYLNNN